MPSYVFEVVTAQGAERYPFTLDHDRVLGPQVTQVLEELRQRGVVLRGKHDDELGVYWSGRELDQTLRAGDLGITAARPIELRMRERTVVAPAVPADASLPRGVLASAVLGYCAGLVAWIVTGLNADLTALAPTYFRLDQLTLLALGALVGAAVLGGAALRRRGGVAAATAAGLLLGGVGALLGGSLVLLAPGSTSLGGFMAARVGGWALAGGLASLLLACYGTQLDPGRMIESLGLGMLAGAFAGVVFALPGPSELWQAVAFTVFGAGLGLAACGPGLWRARALVDLVPARRRVPGILSLREWAVHEGRAVALGSARMGCQDGKLALYPGAAGATLDGRPMTEPAFLPVAAQVGVDGASYRMRRLRGGA